MGHERWGSASRLAAPSVFDREWCLCFDPHDDLWKNFVSRVYTQRAEGQDAEFLLRMTTPRVGWWRVEACLIWLPDPNGLGEGVVDFEDNALCAEVAVELLLVLAPNDGEGVHDVGDRIARGRKAGLKPH